MQRCRTPSLIGHATHWLLQRHPKDLGIEETGQAPATRHRGAGALGTRAPARAGSRGIHRAHERIDRRGRAARPRAPGRDHPIAKCAPDVVDSRRPEAQRRGPPRARTSPSAAVWASTGCAAGSMRSRYPVIGRGLHAPACARVCTRRTASPQRMLRETRARDPRAAFTQWQSVTLGTARTPAGIIGDPALAANARLRLTVGGVAGCPPSHVRPGINRGRTRWSTRPAAP
jgi:hypothetical protein